MWKPSSRLKGTQPKIADRPHRITIWLGLLSPGVAGLAFAVSCFSLYRQFQLEEKLRLPRLYIADESTSFEFFDVSKRYSLPTIELRILQNYVLENGGQVNATLVTDNPTTLASIKLGLPTEIAALSRRSGLKFLSGMTLDRSNLTISPGQRRRRQDYAFYLLSTPALQFLLRSCSNGELHWGLIQRDLDFDVENRSMAIKGWDSRISERHLCMVLNDFLKSGNKNWLDPKGSVIAPP